MSRSSLLLILLAIESIQKEEQEFERLGFGE